MKIITGLLLSLVILFGFTIQTFAVETSANVGVEANINLNNERKEERQEQMQERRELVQERQTQNISDRMDNMKLRIRAHSEWMVKRLTAAVERLEILITRIESRIAKIDDEGGDTTEAVALVAEAKLNIESAKDGIADIDVALETALSKDELRGAFTDLRILVQTIHTDIREAHRALIQAVTTLKGLRIGASANAEIEVE